MGEAAKAVHQVMATLSYGDAISNEAIGIRRVLRAAGYASDIFVETCDRLVEHLTRDYRELLQRPDGDDILIHHFSIQSRASRLAFALPDRMILVYHNITPPEYFTGVHDRLAGLCYLGRRELKAYASRVELALGDSEFNRRELEEAGFPATGVLPVVPDFGHLDATPNRLTAAAFDDDRVNILFVGRVIPSKKIEDVIRFFAEYHRQYNPRSRLIVVGSYWQFEQYAAMLHGFMTARGIEDVHLLGHLSNEELRAYYEIADVFLCASEHEGFCVPIIEAFYMGIPVIAFAATAVPFTMDGAGLLYERKDPAVVAALIDAVVRDRGLRDQLLDGQDQALERLWSRDFATCLLDHVTAVAGKPKTHTAHVAADFWKQVDQADQLEALRLVRPSAYKALPK